MAHPVADRQSLAPLTGAGPGRVPRARRAAAWLAALAAALFAATPARSGPLEVIGGWEGDTHQQGYGFVSLGVLAPAGPGLVVPVRAAASFLYYDYDSSGTTVGVRSPGGSLLAGLRVSGPRGSATLLAGGEVRRERRETAGAAASREETNGGFIVQGDADAALAGRWHASLLGNYAGAASYLWGRAALRYQATNPTWQGPTALSLGIEGVGQGNDESEAFQGGAFAELAFVPQHLSLALHGGYKESWSPGEDHRRGAYAAAGLYLTR